MGFVYFAVIAVWFVAIPTAVARATRDRTGGRLVLLFVLMLLLTTILGALVYLVAHRWFHDRLPAALVAGGSGASADDATALGVGGRDAG
jgi:hypothetical protein